MAEYTGSALYLAFAGTQFDQDYRTFDNSETVDLVDASAGSDTWRTKLTTLKDGTFSFEYVEQAGGTANYAVVAVGSSGTLEWGPEGTTAGKPRFHVQAVINDRTRTIAYDDIVVVTVSGEYSDADGPTETSY